MYIGKRGKGHKGIYVVKSENADEYFNKADKAFNVVSESSLEIFLILDKLSSIISVDLEFSNEEDILNARNDLKKIYDKLSKINSKMEEVERDEFKLYDIWFYHFNTGL